MLKLLKMEFSTTKSPIQQAIHDKLATSFSPSHLEIHNDSSKHAHHQAMQGVDSAETHFRVTIVSDSFQDLPLIERHRAVNTCLKEELEEKGVHAL